MNTYTLDHTTTLVTVNCYSCGTTFAMERQLNNTLRENHRLFYCPNGHDQYYPARSNAEKERERAERAERELANVRTRLIRAQDRAASERRSAAAYKGQVTRLRNRVLAGLCPVPGCRRSFANVGEHVRGVHADYLEEHAALKDALAKRDEAKA